MSSIGSVANGHRAELLHSDIPDDDTNVHRWINSTDISNTIAAQSSRSHCSRRPMRRSKLKHHASFLCSPPIVEAPR